MTTTTETRSPNRGGVLMAREKVAIRLSPSDLAAIDEIAAVELRTRSDMIRVLVVEALAARRRKADPAVTAERGEGPDDL